MWSKKGNIEYRKVTGKEIEDEYKCETAEALSGKWKSLKDSTDIEKSLGTYIDVILITTKKC